jgi:hypothetical protein
MYAGVQVEDPVARVDILEQGGRYIESTEDFLRRTGHWLETEPPEEEIDAQLASDFADFAEPELRALLSPPRVLGSLVMPP